MASKEKKGSFLRWPWNVVIYVLLVLVLRIFAIPVILILLWIQRKGNPHGAAEGYCLSRTRKRLTWLIWALLMLVISAALAAVFLTGLGQDRTYWELMDYVTLAVSGGGAAALFLLGLWLGFIAVRDTFFPAKSTLAQSIRNQLPYPDEAPEVEALFAMVDGDLKENGQWFGPVGIGREWVLGDGVNRIDRIRGIFVINEIHQHHTKTGVRTRRDMELVLIDDRWQRTVTSFNNLKDLQAAADCLSLRVPEAVRGSNGQNMDFWTMDESAREDFERDFRQRQNRRVSDQAQQEILSDGPQDMILTCFDGEVTSRVTLSLTEDQLRRCLEAGAGAFTLTPSRPIEATGKNFRALYVSVAEETIWLLAELADNVGYGPANAVDERQAREILEAWLRREAPDTAGWELRRVYAPAAQGPRTQARQTPPDELALMLASGAAERHTAFTQEDIQIAAEGLADGTYQKVRLSLSKKFLWIEAEAGDQSDARCTVTAARPDPDRLRFFKAQASPRQAAAWLTAYAGGSFLPGGPDWKDCTKQVEKNRK